MPHRLSTQWQPLLTFITDLKAGVQPWLVPNTNTNTNGEREFLVVPSNDVVRKVAGELKERYLREREGREGKPRLKGKDGVGGEVKVEGEEGREVEEEERGKSWRVVEVLGPGGKKEEKEEEEG